MGYVCAQLNYINSGQIFRLSVRDVQRRQEPHCARCGSAASRGSSGASTAHKRDAGSLPSPCTRMVLTGVLSRSAPNYQSLGSHIHRRGTQKKTEVKFATTPVPATLPSVLPPPQSQINQPCRRLHRFREI